MNDETLYALWILTNAGQCTLKTYKALKAFSSFKDVYAALPKDFDSEIFNPEEINSFQNKNTNKAEKIIEDCRKKDIKLITYYDSDYPILLKNIYNPPLALFVSGKLPRTDNQPSITVVGSRKCSENAKKFAFNVTRELALCGFIIVSGVAEGVDSYAQKAVLYSGTPNIVILPCGADVIYSAASKSIYDLTLKNGAIISEFLPGTEARRSNFNIRNRLLSGISHGLLVVEASRTGGTMLTASHAVEQDKTIFAVPGSPFSKLADGTNSLLSDGALVCRSSRDIIDEYSSNFYDKIKPLEQVRQEIIANRYSAVINSIEKESSNNPKLSGNRKKIYMYLTGKTASADSICSELNIPFTSVAEEIQYLEFSGCIEEIRGGFYKAK